MKGQQGVPTRGHLLSARAKVWAAAAVAFGGGYLMSQAKEWLVRPPLVLGQDAISDEASTRARVTLEDTGGPVIRIRPPTGEGRLLLIVYPGGLVRPQAYEWLGRALSRDVETVIPAFPLDLAVTQPGRAGVLIGKYAQGRPVVLAGHSLGGAMAAQDAGRYPDKVAGLVLLAAYPPARTDLRGASFPALSLLAEHDAVAAPQDVRGGLERLPARTELKVVPGAVHSFFGRYGPQRGDGLPTVSRAEAEAAIVAHIQAFLSGVR